MEIEKNSNLFSTIKKDNEEIAILLNELLLELKDMNHMKKIEFLEDKITKNLDENSYSELIRLKSQINRD